MKTHRIFAVLTALIFAASGQCFALETKEVTEFMRTLEEGKSYDFPGVFLDYQKRRR